MISDFKLPKKAVKSPQPGTAETNTDAEQKKPANKDVKAEDFRTPEEIAAEDELMASVTTEPTEEKTPKTLPHWLPSKRVLLITGAVILVGSIGASAFLLTRPNKPLASAPIVHVAKKKVPPKPTTVPSALSGLQVDPSANGRPVIGVMVENSLDARPQSGLSQASIVFEAIAEGGITRFLALFQDTQPGNIGPIRSARPYYVQWALGFNAGYAHVGGSPEALADVKAWGVRDLDQFYNGGSYHRTTDRAAPHNVYTSESTLNDLAVSKGYTSSTFTSFPRKADAVSKVPTAKSVNLTMSGPSFNVHYDYDAATNSYKRSEGGAPHLDAEGSVQLSPKVVVALVMQYGFKSDGYHSDYNTLGSGQMYVFQDGVVTEGQWSKPDNTTQFTFTDAAGKPLALNPGQTWITAVSAASNVSYTP
ncbi:MAG: hypothetical protein JWO41_810 [Candidatus Saccharibacteria bacterium]|nr:hypothetical protein [Candidatus Saccharibacteria bacterium]